MLVTKTPPRLCLPIRLRANLQALRALIGPRYSWDCLWLRQLPLHHPDPPHCHITILCVDNIISPLSQQYFYSAWDEVKVSCTFENNAQTLDLFYHKCPNRPWEFSKTSFPLHPG